MSIAGFTQWIDDKLNPIVVKELRQAVQSKFVVVILLLFLIVQLVIVGIYLVVESGPRGIGALEGQAGRQLFSILHAIMLATCLLFIPLYTGIRLGAERADNNVDLLFVTTLPPRAIISGKILASLMLAVMIFSTITPYLFFTYLLRGIDWPTIWLVVLIDFIAVVAGIHLAVFLAVIPGHWFFKGLIGLLGLFGLFMVFMGAMGITMSMLIAFGTGLIDLPQFWPIFTIMLTGVIGLCAMFYSWSIALLSPPSSNRAFIPRLVFVAFWLVSLAVCFGWNYSGIGVLDNEPMTCWLWAMGMLCCLQLVIATNERESWSPRTARTIPRSWLLRVPALLLYSGAAGGVVLACLLFALTIGIAVLTQPMFQPIHFGPGTPRWDALSYGIPMVLIIGLYAYCYAMTAVLIRQSLARYVSPLFTWVVFVLVFAAACVIPLISMLVLYDDWRFNSHYPWLVTIPFVAIEVLDRPTRYDPSLFWISTSAWAIAVTLLNLPWFFKQLRAFRPYQSVSAPTVRIEQLPQLTQAQAEVTRTLG